MRLISKKISNPQSVADANVLRLFHQMAERVPAYKDFLNKQGIKHKSIKSIKLFREHVPLIDKKNYLSQYPLTELCWDGSMASNYIISVSSGSSGSPFFWPRGESQEVEGALMHKYIYDNIFDTRNKRTLLVVCFSMGTWIAGSFTTASSIGVAQMGEAISVVTPGLDKEEAIKSIKKLASLYDQVILAGYPPFLKDVIEEGIRDGIKWRDLHVRLLTAGEAFSEEWRDHVLKKLGSHNPFFDSVSIYGSADATMLAHETPASVALRRIYNRQKRLRQGMFGTSILPSIMQFDPNHRYFEQVNNELVFSARSGIPLVRYNIHDTGGVYTYNELVKPIKERHQALLERHNIKDTWHLPFVYLNGRKDFTVTIYAVNIYPENIKAALLDKQLTKWATGRFTMASKYYADMDQYFEITIELHKDVVAKLDMHKLFEQVIVTKLKKVNAEYHALYESIDHKAIPKINLVSYNNPNYFGRGIKQTWVKKDV